MHNIRIRANHLSVDGVLNDSATAETIWKALPLRARANTWGDEIYFGIPVETKLEAGASDVVQAGDLAYWPDGTAFCIFFGPTPISRGDEIRAASAVNVVGAVRGDAAVFKEVADGETIHIEKA